MNRNSRLLLPSFLVCLLSSPASATIVRLDVVTGSQAPQAIHIELLDADAPATVANFLNYVDNGAGERRYDGTFVHRLATGFVVQLGGYSFDPTVGSFEGAGVSHIPEDAPVINEFSVDRSNTRGTIAMAKLPGDPDSATSEWFFNLADNSANLDTQNGGFTVFGRVLGSGMDIVDEIATLDVLNVSSFPALPVVDYTPADPIALENLVRLVQVLKDPPAAISPDTTSFTFSPVEVATGPGSHNITVQNIGATDLIIGTIGNTNGLSAPFLISADNCSSRTLVSLQTCTVTTQFSPTTPGDYQDSFNIPSNDSNLPDQVIALSGTGVSSTPFLEVTPAGVIELPPVLIGDTQTSDITVKNSGGGLLLPGTPSITGTDAGAYAISQDNCSGASLALGETCTITIELSGDSQGNKTATLAITAQPGDQSYQTTLSGSVTLPEPDIDVNDQIELGDVMVGQELDSGFGIRSIGKDPLTVTDMEIIGADAALFSIDKICVRVINPGIGCGEPLLFRPVQTMDSVDASIRIYSNDPDTPTLEVPVRASASSDADGIADAIENLAPGGGDGNHDGIADALQPHVASLPNIHGDYITIETAASQTLIDVSALDNPSPVDTPATSGTNRLNFTQGFFSFTIENVPVGGTATVTLRLPESSSASTYFKYGVTPGIPFTNQWYLFGFNGITGAEFSGDRILLHFVDGGFGDNDLMANGRIVDPGGPASILSTGASSAGGGGCSLRSFDRHYQTAPIAIDFFAIIVGLLLMHLGNRKNYRV